MKLSLRVPRELAGVLGGIRGLSRPLICIVLFTVLAALAMAAETNVPPATSNRYLLVLDISRGMQSRSEGGKKVLQSLLESGFQGRLRAGDTIGVWTFDNHLHTGQIPLQHWSPGAQADVTRAILGFYAAQRYQNGANLDEVVQIMERLFENSGSITAIVLSSGNENVRGTPFDEQINRTYENWRDEQRQARMPFVTVLCARQGRITDCTVNPAPWPVGMPAQPAPEARPTVGQLTPVPDRQTAQTKKVEPPSPTPEEAKRVGVDNEDLAQPEAASKPEAAASETEPTSPPETAPAAAQSNESEPTGVPLVVSSNSAVAETGAVQIVVTSSVAAATPVAPPERIEAPPSSEATTAHFHEPPPAAPSAISASGPAIEEHPARETPTSLWKVGCLVGLVLGALALGGIVLRDRRLRRASGASLITRSLNRDGRDAQKGMANPRSPGRIAFRN